MTTAPPNKIDLHPYHPDTPTFRYPHGRYFDRQSVIDSEIGAVIKNLEEDGVI